MRNVVSNGLPAVGCMADSAARLVARVFNPCVRVPPHFGRYSGQNSKSEAFFAPPQEEGRGLAFIDGSPSITAEYRGLGLKSRATSIQCRRIRHAPPAVFVLLAIGWLIGCGPDPAAKDQLRSGYDALERRQYDQADAVAHAYLNKTPHGPGSAEALYLEGRVREARAEYAGDPAQAHAQMEAARDAYNQGVAVPAVPAVQARLHAGLANVAYFEDDFGTAVREWQLAYPNLEKAEDRAWTLYRIGLCQQRLGWFEQADRSFETVIQQYAGTEPANRSAAHQGARGFYVQVGAFTDASHADKTVGALRAQGLNPQKATEPGKQVVRIGPVPSYADARALKVRLSAQFPEAIITP